MCSNKNNSIENRFICFYPNKKVQSCSNEAMKPFRMKQNVLCVIILNQREGREAMLAVSYQYHILCMQVHGYILVQTLDP